MTHELKILPQYFQAVWNETKTFELRKDDRDYHGGDLLLLKEWDGTKYTGSVLYVKVTYILRDAEKYGLKDGYVIMGVRHITSNEDYKPQTNGDRIREMSDYEMADWIADILNHCDNKTPEDECLESCPLYACCNLPFDNIENWLKSPAESSVFESMKRGLEQAINGETRSETLTKDGDGDV